MSDVKSFLFSFVSDVGRKSVEEKEKRPSLSLSSACFSTSDEDE